MYDSQQFCHMIGAEVGKNWLQGSPSSCSGVEFIKWRKAAAEFFLDVELPRQGFNLEDLRTIKQNMECHEVYRKYVTAQSDGKGIVENKWQARLAQSSIKAMRLVEACGLGGWRE